MNVNINLSKCNCEFIAVDNTEYSTMLDKLIFIEFLCYFAYNDDLNTLLPISSSKKISDSTNYQCYRYKTNYDGRYIYCKYGIYNPESLKENNEYKIKDKVFYYNNNIYIGVQNITTLDDLNNTNAKLISNWYLLIKEKDTNPNLHLDYYYTTEFFTYCKLNKCVFNYQRQTVFDYIDACNNICKKDNQKEIRDFLFISLYILEYLVCVGNYSEAQRILENLSSCGNLCDDNLLNISNNCNCK